MQWLKRWRVQAVLFTPVVLQPSQTQSIVCWNRWSHLNGRYLLRADPWFLWHHHEKDGRRNDLLRSQRLAKASKTLSSQIPRYCLPNLRFSDHGSSRCSNPSSYCSWTWHHRYAWYTWAAGVNFSTFDFGVDISIQAATKYIGSLWCNASNTLLPMRNGDQLREQSLLDGDSAYLQMTPSWSSWYSNSGCSTSPTCWK